MTTIVFYKDVLYTDSRHVLYKKGHVPSLVEDRAVGKAYVHDVNGKPSAIIASTDKSPTLRQRQLIMFCLLKKTIEERMEFLSLALNASIKEGEKNIYGSTFVVTADHVYRIFKDSSVLAEEDGEIPRTVELCDDMDWPISYGTGMYLASGYLVSGGDPRKLMEFVSRHDSLTGPHTFAYHRKHLKAISANETRDVYKTVAKGCK